MSSKLNLEIPEPPRVPASVRTLVDMIRTPARECPGAIALGFLDDQARSTDVTYGELYARSLAVAAWLRGHAIAPGDRVLLIYATGHDFVFSFFGTLLAGAVPVPFAPPFGLAKIAAYLPGFEAVVENSGSRCCLTTSRLALLLRGARHARSAPLDVVAFQPTECAPAPQFAEVDAAPADLAFLQYTSGSTSQPKGVMLTHRNLIANVAAFTGAVDVDSRDVLVSWLPLFHDMGLIGMLMGALYARAPLYLIAPELFIKRPALWLTSITRWGATLTCAPNFAFHYCVKHIADEALTAFNLGTLRAVLNGAEPVDLDALTGFARKFARAGLREDVILPVYGLAESSLAVSFPALGRVATETVDLDHLERHGEARGPEGAARRKTFVSVGKPIASQQIQIWDDANFPLGERWVGEIVVRGPSVMQGYYGNAPATAAALTHGWLHTGDHGYISAGNLYITGRKKDLIIRRGRNYVPQDIEAVAGSVAGVRKGRVVAFGIAGDDSETEIAIVCETRVAGAEARGELARQIKLAVARSFPFSPSDVKLVAPGAIPRTSSGKVRRQPCKASYLQGTLDRRREPAIAVALRMLKILVASATHAARKARHAHSYR